MNGPLLSLIEVCHRLSFISIFFEFQFGFVSVVFKDTIMIGFIYEVTMPLHWSRLPIDTPCSVIHI